MRALEIVSVTFGCIGILPVIYSIFIFCLNNKIVKYSDNCRSYIDKLYNTQSEEIKKLVANLWQNFEPGVSFEQCNDFLKICKLDKRNRPQWYIYRYWKKQWKLIKKIYFPLIRITTTPSRFLEIENKLYIFIGISHNTINIPISNSKTNKTTNWLLKKIRNNKPSFKNCKKNCSIVRNYERYWYFFVETDNEKNLTDLWWQTVGRYEIINSMTDEIYSKYHINSDSHIKSLKLLQLKEYEEKITPYIVIGEWNKNKIMIKENIFNCDIKLFDKLK